MDDAVTYADMYRVLDEPVSRTPAPGWKVDAYRILPAPLTMLLGEGDLVDLGDRRLRVLHLPGHSPNSIGLLDERDGLFFSGDAIYDDTLIDDLADSDRAAYRATMARIIDLPVRIAYGGHGESFSGERMREIARALYQRRLSGCGLNQPVGSCSLLEAGLRRLVCRGYRYEGTRCMTSVPGIHRRFAGRDHDAGPGYRDHHPQHAVRRARGGHLHGAWNLQRA